MEQSGLITLKDVESRYQNASGEQVFLKSINLSVNAKETVAIVGRAHTGKNALLRAIALLDRPLTGIVSIDNKNLTFLASKEIARERRNIGFVSNSPILLQTKTVLENIALPLRLQGFNKIDVDKLSRQALSRANLDDVANVYPARLNKLQIIKTELARSLVNNPKILVLEDVFSNLDSKSTEKLINLLQKIKSHAELTVLLTTNDTTIIKAMCDSVIVMQNGTVAERCSVLELFTNPKSDMAKEFVRFNCKNELPLTLRKKIVTQGLDKHHAIVRINFIDCLAPEEILNNSIEAYELRMNIIQAYQEKIQAHTVNIMLIEVYGDHKTMLQAVEFLNQNELHSEVIGYVADAS